MKIRKTPLCMQINPIECGAAALSIVLSYYNQSRALHELNRLVGVSRFGTNARALITAAESLGFKAYAQKIIVNDLKYINYLSILFVDNSHFVVFEGYSWGRFYINDPARGRYNLSAEELRKRLSGMHIVLEPGECLRRKNTWPIFSDSSLDFFALIFGIIFGVIIAIFASSIALNMAEGAKFLNFVIIFLIFLIYLCWLYVLGSNLKFKNLYAHKISSWLLAHITKSGSDFFTTRPFASFSQTFKNLNTLTHIDLPVSYINSILFSAIFVIILTLFFIYWPFAILALALCLILQVLAQPQSETSLVDTHAAQAYEHYADLAAMGQNRQLIDNQNKFTVEYLSHKIFFTNYYAYFSLLFLVPLIFYWGSQGVQEGRLTNIEIYAVLILIIFLFFLVNYLLKNLAIPRKEHRQTLFNEIADLAVDTRNKKYNNNNLIKVINGNFIYTGEKKAVLKDFNLVLERSKIYAVLAPPMAGVSTLLKLLGQKLTWTDGEQKLESPAMRIALIDDEADLFEASLLENIRLFDRHMSEAQVILALKNSCAEELFYQRPMGLLTQIHAHGSNLSGGEKKRLLLARALVHEPDLIILDEFFDTLEINLAIKIISNLRMLKHSVIFSSQRPEEQQLADQIISWSIKP
jgi:ABC-type bacteriocin/lantibiotic exporter with double-glycine peptidase domain